MATPAPPRPVPFSFPEQSLPSTLLSWMQLLGLESWLSAPSSDVLRANSATSEHPPSESHSSEGAAAYTSAPSALIANRYPLPMPVPVAQSKPESCSWMQLLGEDSC